MKVFSLEKFKEDFKKWGDYNKNYDIDWAKDCDGLTEHECDKLGCVVHPDWMIEKEETE